ncbi:UNVERIFIED_CONTAM: NDR1/HIN1-like protein 13 [Sesamum calycinum]|uniref:NDR1/HIN1-like protein 13 n=1 Tax=Sesamum calycinum TaxID=2727403 RepID=A0AAW2J3F0_9LAMI
MADSRVHPTTADSHPPPPSSSSAATSPKHSTDHPIPPNPPHRSQSLPRRLMWSCCRRCCCFTLCLLVFLVIAAAVSAGVLYLVFRFKSPKYTVTHLAIKGMNLTSAAPISPGFDVTIRAENPNSKVGIYYLKDSSVNVFYNDVKLSSGVLPAFYQPRKNVTVLQTALTGSDVVLGGTVKTALSNAQNQGRIPFVVKTKAPVKIEVGSVKTWEITVKVKCDVVVDGLNQKGSDCVA